jgi:hypothetical protein
MFMLTPEGFYGRSNFGVWVCLPDSLELGFHGHGLCLRCDKNAVTVLDFLDLRLEQDHQPGDGQHQHERHDEQPRAKMPAPDGQVRLVAEGRTGCGCECDIQIGVHAYRCGKVGHVTPLTDFGRFTVRQWAAKQSAFELLSNEQR